MDVHDRTGGGDIANRRRYIIAATPLRSSRVMLCLKRLRLGLVGAEIPSARCDLQLPGPTKDRRTRHARIIRRAPATVPPRPHRDDQIFPVTGDEQRRQNIEILTLRHQLAVLQRQVDKSRLTPPDRAFLAALLHKIPKPTPRQLPLIVSPDTVLRWHRNLLRRRHASAFRPRQPSRPRTIRSIRTLVRV
jgi:hypothetical protein